MGLAFAVCLPSAVRATMTYELVSGSVSLTVDEYVPGVGFYRAGDSVTVDLASAALIIDLDTNQIVSLDLSSMPGVAFELREDTAAYEYADYRTLVLESFTVQAYSGTLLGSGFSFGDDVSVEAWFSATGVNGAVPISSAYAAPMFDGDLSEGPLFGDVASGGMISLNGIAVGMYESPLDDNYFVVTGDFSFVASASVTAPVPEPGAVPLFLVGLFVAGSVVRSRNREVKGLR